MQYRRPMNVACSAEARKNENDNVVNKNWQHRFRDT